MSKFLAILFIFALGTGLCHQQIFTMSDPFGIEGPSEGVISEES